MALATPTATASLSTTCLVVSRPASTWTATFRNGETGFFPATTYTSPGSIVYTDEATIDATCFTLSPGQTIPTSVAFVGVSCSSDYYPGSTETTTYTYTPGEPLVFFGQTVTSYTGTTTKYVTATYTHDPRTDVFCTPLPDVHNPATCDSITPLTWASLVITFITVQLMWWLFELPLLWKNPNPDANPADADADADADDRPGGVRTFLSAITWSCIRANAPGCAGLFALAAGRDTSEYAAMYYLGVRRHEHDGRAPQFTTWKLVTSVGGDLLSVVAAAVTVYQTCTLPEYAPQRFGASLWAYPSLPNALIGLTMLVGRAWFPRTQRAAVWLVLLVVGVVVLVGVAIALVLWRFAQRDNLWFVSVVFYGLMAFPAVLFSGPFVLIAVAYGCFGRVGGVGIAALQHLAGGQPYCKMPGKAFGVVYIVLGVVSALLAAYGILLHHKVLHSWRQWYKSHPLKYVSPEGMPTGVAHPDRDD